MKNWRDKDKAIGKWIDEHGVENYEQCPIIRRTMLFGRSVRNNTEWQYKHYLKMLEFNPCMDNVTEIGAGVGALVGHIAYLSRYIIYDLPNIQKVQKYVIEDDDVEWVTEPMPMENGLIVSIFALSEMEYQERTELLHLIGINNTMFFAFQENHEGMNNWLWFTNLGKYLERDFTIAPMEIDKCWYMYVEAR